MIKEFIGTGKTVEEATQNAKLQLNAPEMADVHVEVIKYPEKKKFFGLIGGCDAEVKVSYDDGKREKKADAPKKSYEKSGLKKQVALSLMPFVSLPSSALAAAPE